MLDRPDPGHDGIADPLGALGVGEDVDPCRVGFLDEHLELVRTEVGMARVVAGGHHATRGGHLDAVGTRPDEFADLLPHLVRSVDDVVRDARVAGHHPDALTARPPSVSVSARLGDHDQRHEHPGPSHEPLLHGLLHAEARPSGIAYGRDPGVERGGEVMGGLEVPQGKGFLRLRDEVHRGQTEVDVAVDEAREDRRPRRVHHHVPVEVRADLDDPPVLEHDVGHGRVCGGSVEHRAAGHEGAGHRDVLLRGRAIVGPLTAGSARSRRAVPRCRRRPARSPSGRRTAPSARPARSPARPTGSDPGNS